MWTALIGLAASIIPALLKLFTGGGNDQSAKDARELGQAETRDAVSTDALRRQEADRKSKESTDALVRNTPYSDRVDRL